MIRFGYGLSPGRCIDGDGHSWSTLDVGEGGDDEDSAMRRGLRRYCDGEKTHSRRRFF